MLVKAGTPVWMGVKTPEYKDSEVSPIIFDNVVYLKV